MNLEELKNQLIQIYNALSTISTKGEDSITMVKCFQTINYIINNFEFYKKEEE